jgi:hypothetical protein
VLVKQKLRWRLNVKLDALHVVADVVAAKVAAVEEEVGMLLLLLVAQSALAIDPHVPVEVLAIKREVVSKKYEI